MCAVACPVVVGEQMQDPNWFLPDGDAVKQLSSLGLADRNSVQTGATVTEKPAVGGQGVLVVTDAPPGVWTPAPANDIPWTDVRTYARSCATVRACKCNTKFAARWYNVHNACPGLLCVSPPRAAGQLKATCTLTHAATYPTTRAQERVRDWLLPKSKDLAHDPLAWIAEARKTEAYKSKKHKLQEEWMNKSTAVRILAVLTGLAQRLVAAIFGGENASEDISQYSVMLTADTIYLLSGMWRQRGARRTPAAYIPQHAHCEYFVYVPLLSFFMSLCRSHLRMDARY